MGRIILEDGSQYLPVKFRISEFYQQHPKGKIRTSLMWFDRQNNNPGFVESVLIKAEVYRDDATLLAEAYSQRRCEPQEPSFFECAETVAIGRALSDAGYSVYSEDLGDDPCKRKIMLDDGSFYLKDCMGQTGNATDADPKRTTAYDAVSGDRQGNDRE